MQSHYIKKHGTYCVRANSINVITHAKKKVKKLTSRSRQKRPMSISRQKIYILKSRHKTPMS